MSYMDQVNYLGDTMDTTNFINATRVVSVTDISVTNDLIQIVHIEPCKWKYSI